MSALTPPLILTGPTADQSALAAELFGWFREPANTWRPKVVWFFNGQITPDETRRQLAAMQAVRLGGPAIFAYPGLQGGYLSDEWFASVKVAVDEAARLGLEVWILDEGAYPSGFADGQVTADFPQFRSKVVRAATEDAVGTGETWSWTAGDEPVLAVVATSPGQPDQDLGHLLCDGRITWQAPAGDWTVRVYVQRRQSHPCRSVSGGGPKDFRYSLPDYLEPAATARFLEVTHERYAAHVGEHFGTTLKGFFGDEPCLPQWPWTERFAAAFTARHGYDLRPLLPALFDAAHPEHDGVVYDYFTVLAELWTSGFYQPQTDWCAARELVFCCHICGEEQMMTLIHQLNADFFGSLKGVAEPGIDAIWRQIHFGCESDFPKLGSSAAQTWGKPRNMTESFAIYGTGTTFEQLKYVSDYQGVRGVNEFFLMMWNYHTAGRERVHHPPDFSTDSTLHADLGGYADYLGRLCLLMGSGTPLADLAVYYPTRSAWLGDGDALDATHRLGRRLLEAQRDFVWLDDDALAEACEVVEGTLQNGSGTRHAVAIVGPTRVLDAAAADRLDEFVRAGGTLLVLAPLPTRFGGRRTRATRLTDLLGQLAAAPDTWVACGAGRARLLTDETAVTGVLNEALPPRVAVSPAAPALRLAGREVAGVQVWLATNEGEEPIDTTLSTAWGTAVEVWDAEHGTCRPAAPLGGGVRLQIPPRGSRVLVVGDQVAGTPRPEPHWQVLANVPDDWQWTFGQAAGAGHHGPLVPWSEVGRPEYSGDVLYDGALELSAAPDGPCLLDLGEVRYVAEVWVNGSPAGTRLWPPHAVEVTGLLRAGRNEVRVRVTNTPANRIFARPEDRAAYEQAGWFEGTYLPSYERFEADSLLSGLLGPVRVWGT